MLEGEEGIKACQEDLMQLKASLEQRFAEMMPVTTQLTPFRQEQGAFDSGFLI